MSRNYKAGDNVTFRLKKSDQDIADFLNQVEKPSEVIIAGLRLMMQKDPDIMATKQDQGCTPLVMSHLAEILARLHNLENILTSKLEQSATLEITEVTTKPEDDENEDESDPDVSRALDLLAEW